MYWRCLPKEITFGQNVVAKNKLILKKANDKTVLMTVALKTYIQPC